MEDPAKGYSNQTEHGSGTETAGARICEVMLVAFTCFLLFLYIFRFLAPSKPVQPPGPWGVPILGFLPFLGSQPHLTFDKMRKNYGDVIQLRMGSVNVVVLQGKECIREALVSDCQAFSGRPGSVFAKVASQGKTIAFSTYNEQYRLQRRLLSSAIIQTARRQETLLADAVSKVAKDLARKLISTNQPQYPLNHLQNAILDIGLKFMFGAKYSTSTNNVCAKISENFVSLSEAFSGVQIIDIMPWTEIFFKSRIKNLAKITNDLDNLAKDIAAECLDEGKHTDEWRGAAQIITRLGEQYTDQLKSVKLTPDNLMSNAVDLLGGGYETGGSILIWFILYMAKFPRVQERIHSELQSLNADELSSADRTHLPYTEATWLEVGRHVCITPLALPRCTTQDSQICGYQIKKGTVIFPNLYTVNWCKDAWQEPERFYPERFLTENGQCLDADIVDRLCLFGMGKRRCIGERIARSHFFLLIAGLMKQIRVRSSPEHPVSLHDCEIMLTKRPKEYRVIIEPFAC